MKKVININFQGRVIPIEESAYEILKNYTDSLRRYFANEEGRDEIINDIENRIAELFTEELKKNQTGCITDVNVEAIIKSIGRPEDFDGDIAEASSSEKTYSSSSTSSSTSSSGSQSAFEPRGSLYRNANDKVLGGVCGGLAHYLRIDPTIVRVLFALITFGGFGSGVLLYIILWIVLPAKGMQSDIRRRLYRNPDNKVIGGVAGGISAYFNIPVWVPRVIFALPLIIGLLNSVFRGIWGFWGFDSVPHMVFSGFGGTLTLIYIILWIVIPEANTASEKLEMRGEKVDLESIKNSVQEELQGVKGRAEKFGSEFSEKAKEWGKDFSEKSKEWGKEVNERSRAFSAEISPAASRAGNGFGHAIGVLFKAFFLFIAGVIVFALFVAMMAILFSGVGMFGLRNFILNGIGQNFLAISTLVLFMGVPIIAAVVWLIRRMSGMRSKNNYLGYIFGSLWLIGLFSVIFLSGLITREFKRQESIKEEVVITSPSSGKMAVDLKPVEGKYYGMFWFNDNDNDRAEIPALSEDENSMLLNTVRIKIARSKDSSYHAYLLKFARANTSPQAEANAEKISFPVTQKDSILYLPKGFAISKETKFRNQQVMVVIEVPEGRQIRIDNSTEFYSWFNVNTKFRGRGLNLDWDEDWWDNDNSWRTDVWYTMTASGLERTDKKSDQDVKDDWNSDDKKNDNNNGEYRYKKGDQDIKIDSIDIKLKSKDTTINIKLNTMLNNEDTEKESGEETVANEKPTRVSSYTGHMISVFNMLGIADK
jgi:phage shock protein PspC (stress-responsive transcriptional regulator)